MSSLPPTHHTGKADYRHSRFSGSHSYNKFRPYATSVRCVGYLTLFTRMGFPYNLIMFRILIACARFPHSREPPKQRRRKEDSALHHKNLTTASHPGRDVTHVIGILFASKLHESIALVQIRDPVLRHVHIHCSNQQRDTHVTLRSPTSETHTSMKHSSPPEALGTRVTTQLTREHDNWTTPVNIHSLAPSRPSLLKPPI